MATSDEVVGKNFRSTYYESLGFRENEKSISQLENILKLEIIDITKLKVFCIKNCLPVFYRPLIWKLVLKSEPCHQDKETHSYIMEQKSQQFKDLKQALLVLGSCQSRPPFLPSPSSNGATPESIVYMYCLQMGKLADIKHNIALYKDLCAVARPFLEWYDNEMEAYFTFVGFCNVLDDFKIHEHTMEVESSLSQRDNLLYLHLSRLNAFSVIPLKRWFRRCFVSDLPLAEIEILWDKIIAGSCLVLLYTAIAMILYHRRHLMDAKNAEQIDKFLNNCSEDDASVIIRQGIETWETNGSPLLPSPLSAEKQHN